MSVGDLARFHHLFAPLLFATVRAPSPYCYRCPLGLERSTCRTDCVEALAERRQTEVSGPRAEGIIVGLESAAVVANRERDFVHVVAQRDLRPRCARVAPDVRERFVRDADA